MALRTPSPTTTTTRTRRTPGRPTAILVSLVAAFVVAVPVLAIGPASLQSIDRTAALLSANRANEVPATPLIGRPTMAFVLARSIHLAVHAGIAPGLLADVLIGAVRPDGVMAALAPAAAPHVAPRPTVHAAPSPRPRATHHTTTHVVSRQTTTSVRYVGRNHVWIPSRGSTRSVSRFSCSRSAPPVDLVYRWGCAGANNVYLFGHAYSVFKPLHDAYAAGRLRKGMLVKYADGSGRVHTYALSWWRLTTPDNGAFAYAAQSRPSMTLQTCYGSRSRYRLIVRLAQVG
jgi:hypothetical protein